MRKKLLLLTAVLSASANFMFAEEKTVQDSNGNTFTYDTVRDLDENSEKGDTIYPNAASFDINPEQYKMTLKSDLRATVSDANLTYNVKLTNASDNPGTIAPFTERMKSQSTIYEIGTKEDDIVYTIYDGIYVEAYTPKTNTEEFAKYVVACKRAKEIQPSVVYSGIDLKAAKWNNTVVRRDDDGVDIVDDLYYMVFRRNKFLPILNIDGDYAKGITYNGCYVTYKPTEIADGYMSYTVDGYGKVGYVHGVVDDGKVEEILANDDYKFFNFDFTDASVLGSVATDIDDNRIAYFAKNTDATGQNIVVGSTCESYVISDNNQEIFVSKAFSAGESQYKRSFTPDTYGTIVLPFSVSNPGNIFIRQAVFTGYSSAENKMTFSCTSMIAPNTPHLFKVLPTVAGESTLYGPVNGTIEATAEAKSAKYEGAQFAGTFEGLPAENVSQVYVVGAVGKIGKTKKALKPGRCYFTREDPDNFARSFDGTTIEFIDEDGTTTINEHELNESHELSGAVYDLQGRRVENPTKGLYIVNGKKVVIK